MESQIARIGFAVLGAAILGTMVFRAARGLYGAWRESAARRAVRHLIAPLKPALPYLGSTGLFAVLYRYQGPEPMIPVGDPIPKIAFFALGSAVVMGSVWSCQKWVEWVEDGQP